VDSIAGICNKNKNVFGLMPHPERAMEEVLGSADGVKMLEGLMQL
jgi:phosphoribosylformylglycinamidine synthase